MTIGATLVGLLMLAEQDSVVVTSLREVIPKYHRNDYGSACGSAVFQVRFRNGPEESGQVEHLQIDGRRVRNAAETLQIRAARRAIVSIEIMNCGMDPLRPVFRGVMVLSEGESRAAGMGHLLFFRLSRQEKDWKIALD